MTLDTIVHDRAENFLPALPPESVHALVSDIPYGIGAEEWDVLHRNTNSSYRGRSPAQEKAGRIFKTRGKPLNGWSEADRRIPREYYEWCATWAPAALGALKPGASAIIFAGRRLAHRCICAFEDAGFTLKDVLAWVRPRAPHRAQRMSVVFERRGDRRTAKQWAGWRLGNLRPVFEPMLWFTKPYTIGRTIADNVIEHGTGGYNEEAFVGYNGTPNNVLEFGFEAGEGGLHPTQKPVRLMQALIELTTRPGQTVLDPFCGSGSTLLAARMTGRRFLGCEHHEGHHRVAVERLSDPQIAPIDAD